MNLNWTKIQSVYTANAAEHSHRAASLGLEGPLDVFEQLFHDHHDDPEMARLWRFVD